MIGKGIPFIFLLLFFSCSKNKNQRTWVEDEELEVESSNFGIQSINENETAAMLNENVVTFNNTSEIDNNLLKVETNIEKINSPDKLIELKQVLQEELNKTHNAIMKISNEEEKINLEKRYNSLQSDYDNKIKAYLMPANGIIQNLHKQIDRLAQCKSKSDVMNILDTHYGFYKNLSQIHTIVEEKNRQPEVRELASKLQEIFTKTIDKYDIDFQ